MLRTLMIGALLCGLLPSVLDAQDSGRALLSAARKRAMDARGKEGEERAAVLRDCERILAVIPEKYSNEKPAVARAWLELGRTRKRLGKLKEAQAAFEKVLLDRNEQRPCCDALHELASLHKKGKRPAEAIAALQDVVKSYPTQARSRARALIRMGGLYRDMKQMEQAEAMWRQCLKEHGDLWRQSVDALNALVALKLRAKDVREARRILDAHTAALRSRFAGTKEEERLEAALAKMTSRVRLAKTETEGKEGNDR